MFPFVYNAFCSVDIVCKVVMTIYFTSICKSGTAEHTAKLWQSLAKFPAVRCARKGPFVAQKLFPVCSWLFFFRIDNRACRDFVVKPPERLGSFRSHVLGKETLIYFGLSFSNLAHFGTRDKVWLTFVR